jgi:hypothetical protein
MSDQEFPLASRSLSPPRKKVAYPGTSKGWCAVAFAIAMALPKACSDSLAQSGLNAQNNLRRFRATAQDAVPCRETAARDPRYQITRAAYAASGHQSCRTVATPRSGVCHE